MFDIKATSGFNQKEQYSEMLGCNHTKLLLANRLHSNDVHLSVSFHSCTNPPFPAACSYSTNLSLDACDYNNREKEAEIWWREQQETGKKVLHRHDSILLLSLKRKQCTENYTIKND